MILLLLVQDSAKPDGHGLRMLQQASEEASPHPAAKKVWKPGGSRSVHFLHLRHDVHDAVMSQK